jgi:alkylation response protein AidB-like acyl-CoA dehydrogenase
MSGATDPAEARKRLGLLGAAAYDTRSVSLWERDTETLPAPFRAMRARYRDFARRHIAPRALEVDAAPHGFDPRELFVRSAAHGFQTELLPAPWGTMRLGCAARSLLLCAALKAEEMCAACGGIGLSLLAHDLGVAPLFVSGDVRAARWMARIYAEIKAGEPAMAAFAITEPAAGSDVQDTGGARTARLGCRARECAHGWVLNGRKCFISDGAVARWITLFAADEGKGIESWSCYLLDSAMPGLSVGRSERKMGQRGADASELVLDEVLVPRERLMGPRGAGWAINRNVLNFSRPIVGAIALGIARGALEHALEFCNTTHLGARRLVDYQDVQLSLADMIVQVAAMRATVWQAVRYRVPFQAAASIAKVFCSDTAWKVCTAAMQLLGDHGNLHARGVEKAARDARLTQIYEGTNQINRLAIVEGQRGAEIAR